MGGHSDRAHALLSASSAHRWLECPPSALAAEAYPKHDTDFTREGTLAHEVAEAYVRGAVTPDMTEAADQEMLECAAGYADYIRELVIGEDHVVLLEQRVDFSPWVPEGFGTADCIIIQGTSMDVIDYKYGKGVAVSAEDNPQEMLYGLGALNDYGFAYDIRTVRLHIYQPRINNISVDELTAEELLAWGERIKPVAEQAAKGKGKYNAGAWCRFCAHAGRCRKLAGVCTEYVESHGLRAKLPILAPHEVAEVLTMEPLVTMWLKRVREQALTTLLEGGEIPNYKVVEGKLGNRKWTDELAVVETLKAGGYEPDAYTETKLLSPAAMDKAIGKRKVAELLAQLIDRAPGAPTVVPASDKRPAYDRLAEAQNDFKET